LQGQVGLVETDTYGAGLEPSPAFGVIDASSSGSVLIEDARPRGTELAALITRRYIGFILVFLVAVLMIAFLPSLRHSSNPPSGLGPTARSGQRLQGGLQSAPSAGWVAPSAVVVSVGASYL
jgi:hypothetical protein